MSAQVDVEEMGVGAGSAASSRVWLGIATLLAGTLLPPLDFFIVNLAIPSIQHDLGGGDMLGQQVVASYAATYAVTLTLGGRVGDLFGRRRIFLIGLVGFALASLVCGVASSPGLLVAGRMLQGITAALTAPQSLALIRANLDGRRQGIALGLHGTVFGLAAATGQSLGGLLIAANLFGLGWRVTFLINLPVVALALIGSLFLHTSRPDRTERLDLPGAVLLSVGLAAVVVPLLEGSALGWPWWCWASLPVAAATLLGFWRREAGLEQRMAVAVGSARPVVPLVPPSAVTARGVRPALVGLLLFYSIGAFFLVFSEYQQSHGRTPFQAGLDILPLGIGFLLGPLTQHRLSSRLPRGVAALGLGLEAAGFICFVAMALCAGQTRWSAIPLAAIGFGQGLALPALIRLAVTRVPRRYAGLASGLVSATLQISLALSVAVLGGVYYLVDNRYGSTAGIATVCLLIAALLLGAAIVAVRTERIPA